MRQSWLFVFNEIALYIGPGGINEQPNFDRIRPDGRVSVEQYKKDMKYTRVLLDRMGEHPELKQLLFNGRNPYTRYDASDPTQRAEDVLTLRNLVPLIGTPWESVFQTPEDYADMLLTAARIKPYVDQFLRSQAGANVHGQLRPRRAGQSDGHHRMARDDTASRQRIVERGGGILGARDRQGAGYR